jgi:hypothetical protein
VSYWVAKRANLEAVGQRAESRSMAGFPCLPETNHAYAEFHRDGARNLEVLRPVDIPSTFAILARGGKTNLERREHVAGSED